MTDRLGRTLALALFVGLVMTLSACGADFSTPEATLKNYAKAMQDRDEDLYKQCLVKAEADKHKKEAADGDDKKATVTAAGVKDEHGFKVGTLKIQIEGEEADEMPVILVEEDGQWKVSNEKIGEYMLEKFKEEGFDDDE